MSDSILSPSASSAVTSRKSLWSIFFGSLLASVLLFLAYFYLENHVWHPRLQVYQLPGGLFVTGQIKEGDIGRALLRRGVRTIIDVRPDGEAPDQPPAEHIRAAASRFNMVFVHIPVAHGQIPEQAVTALRDAVEHNPRHVLLYCRSGNRAARTYALVLASQLDGPGLDEILSIVKSTGHSADDLRPEIEARIAKRTAQK